MDSSLTLPHSGLGSTISTNLFRNTVNDLQPRRFACYSVINDNRCKLPLVIPVLVLRFSLNYPKHLRIKHNFANRFNFCGVVNSAIFFPGCSHSNLHKISPSLPTRRIFKFNYRSVRKCSHLHVEYYNLRPLRLR